MTADAIPQCPPNCDLVGTDGHDMEAQANGVTVVHHQRQFGPVTLYLDEKLGQPSYAVRVHVDEEDVNASEDPAVGLMQLASAALQAATYLAQLSGPPEP